MSGNKIKAFKTSLVAALQLSVCQGKHGLTAHSVIYSCCLLIFMTKIRSVNTLSFVSEHSSAFCSRTENNFVPPN